MKRILCLIMVLGFAVLSVGCGVEIADNNGPDDCSLATITAENIIKQDLGSSGYAMSPGSEDDDYMEKTTKFKGKDFSGVAQIYMTGFLGKSDVCIDVSGLTVNSGNFALVVMLNDEIVHEFKVGELMETFELEDINGTLEIIMAGESADFKFWISMI